MASSQSGKHLPSSVAAATPLNPNPISDLSPSTDAMLDLDLSDGAPPPLSSPIASSPPSSVAPVSAAVAASVSPSPSLPPPSPTLDLVNPSIVFFDPWLLRFSAAYNRDEASFDSPDFKELLRSVIAHNGNLQPICVVERIDADGQTFYEVVFGERRVRACREAGVKVRAMVMQSRSAMDNALLRLGENRGRRELAPVEFGRQVKHVLDDPGCRLNRTQLAKILGCHVGHLGRAYELASLPSAILEAFESPLELQYAHMLPLKRAYEAQPVAVLLEAERIREELDPLTTAVVVERLEQAAQRAQAEQQAKEGGNADTEDGGGRELASCKSVAPATQPQPIRAKGRAIGYWQRLPSGAITLQIDEQMSDFQSEELVASMVEQLERKVMKVAAAKRSTKASAPEMVPVATAGEQA
jgi:ParB family chromosome partitioning protein